MQNQVISRPLNSYIEEYLKLSSEKARIKFWQKIKEDIVFLDEAGKEDFRKQFFQSLHESMSRIDNLLAVA